MRQSQYVPKTCRGLLQATDGEKRFLPPTKKKEKKKNLEHHQLGFFAGSTFLDVAGLVCFISLRMVYPVKSAP